MTDKLMDAKAKVVAYMVTEPATAISLKSSYAYTLDECDNAVNPDHEPLIKLTDHEAALAELQQYYEIVQQDWADAVSKGIAQANRLTTLLTGLEALAGEWRKRATGCGDAGNYKMEIAYDCAADELTTLTNSAKGNDDGR